MATHKIALLSIRYAFVGGMISLFKIKCVEQHTGAECWCHQEEYWLNGTQLFCRNHTDVENDLVRADRVDRLGNGSIFDLLLVERQSIWDNLASFLTR